MLRNPDLILRCCPRTGNGKRKSEFHPGCLLYRLPVSPALQADDPTEARLREVAGGYSHALGFNAVQNVLTCGARALSIHIRGKTPGGLRHLRRMNHDVSANECVLPIRRDKHAHVSWCVA